MTVTDATGTPERPDRDLLGLDVAAGITHGLMVDGGPRRALFSEAAIAASWRAERSGVGPYPLNFLARYVRAAGRSQALNLAEPLRGAEATALARDWLTAACEAGGGIPYDDVLAQWLEMVAALIAMRRTARGQDGLDGR